MEVEEFLAHHGIKGMHWGVRKSEDSDSSSGGSSNNHQQAKKVAKIAGGVIVAAAVTAGAIYLAKHPELLKSPANPATAEKGKSFVEDLAKAAHEEPTSPLLATRGKHIGNGFLMKGGLSDPLPEYEKAGFNGGGVDTGNFRRYGEKLEKVAVAFNDPEGRKDNSGRIINHEVVIPKQHAAGIDNFEDAKNKAHSLIKPVFDPFYEKSTMDEYRYKNTRIH